MNTTLSDMAKNMVADLINRPELLVAVRTSRPDLKTDADVALVCLGLVYQACIDIADAPNPDVLGTGFDTTEEFEAMRDKMFDGIDQNEAIGDYIANQLRFMPSTEIDELIKYANDDDQEEDDEDDDDQRYTRDDYENNRMPDMSSTAYEENK